MELLDGRKAAAEIKEEIALEVRKLKKDGVRAPHLAAVLIGTDPASETYVSMKVRDCEEVGFHSTLIRRDSAISEEELLRIVDKLNEDPDIDGFIVQLPLPDHIDERKIIMAIDPNKDVDGFHPVNVGKMALGLPCFLPATPSGVLELLKRNKVETEGKHCVVLGRSNIVGSPMSILMSRNKYPGNATVTLCHSRSKNIGDITRQADIIIIALGKPGFLTADMVKEGVVIVDVGTNRISDKSKKAGYRLSGDVKFEEVSAKSSKISPVPGGVGPMTRVSLLLNTLKAVKER